jgi:hypothetical protein
MKPKWSKFWVALLCLILFTFVVNAQTTKGRGQHSAQRSKETKTAPSQKDPKRLTQPSTGAKATATPVPATTNRSTPVSPEDPTELASARKDRHDRITIALQRAQEAAGEVDDHNVKEQLKQLSSEAQSLNQAIDHAENLQELTTLDTKIDQFENAADAVASPARSWPGIFSFRNFLTVIPIVLSLAALAAVAYVFFTFQTRLDEIIVRQHASMRAEQELTQSLKENKEHSEKVEANLTRVADDLGLRIDSAKRNSEEAKRLARVREAQANSSEPLRTEATIDVLPEPTFPALVADYLSRLRPSQPTAVDADFRTNKLVTATAESAPFVFIADGDGSGTGIVLPRPRLQRSQEFSSYYKDYYHCSDPTAGEVFIIEPAIVRPDGNGWRLSHMGRMEIR